jgi:hypothetical protein
MAAKTLYEKIYDAHVVYEAQNETPLLYIDRHLVHEVTSPQAFDGLRAHHRPVRQPGKTFATMDHNVSTQTKDINASGEMAIGWLCWDAKGHGERDSERSFLPDLDDIRRLRTPNTAAILCGSFHMRLMQTRAMA